MFNTSEPKAFPMIFPRPMPAFSAIVTTPGAKCQRRLRVEVDSVIVHVCVDDFEAVGGLDHVRTMV
jgi:hypothetical protein